MADILPAVTFIIQDGRYFNDIKTENLNFAKKK